MVKQITISLVKIMNWSHTENDVKLQLSFLSSHNKAYIAHKSVIGKYIDNTILLNTSFKISYHQNEQKLICKITLIKQNRIKESVGEAELDLECFSTRKIQYIAFNDRDKVIEIHRVDDTHEQKKENYEQQYVQRDQESQQNFLQQRYNFLDKITNKQIQLKKNFSQKVYNLLKDIKYARAAQNLKKQFQDKNLQKDKQEYNFDTPQKQMEDKNEKIKKMQQKLSNLNNLNQNLVGKHQTNKYGKPYKLMIDSIQAYGKKQPARQYHNIYSKNHQHNNLNQDGEYAIHNKRSNKEPKAGIRN